MADAWWTLPEGEVHEALMPMAMGSEDSDHQRYCRACLDLYHAGIEAKEATCHHDYTAFNVVRAISDIIINQLYSQRVAPLFLTTGGTKEERDRAELMQRAVMGVLEQSGIYGDLGARVAHDAVVLTGGHVYVWPDVDGQCVRIERVFPWELRVSEEEAERGDPRSMLFVQRRDRAEMLSLFPAHEQAIKDAEKRRSTDTTYPDTTSSESMSDEILVVRGWRLPHRHVDIDDDGDTKLDVGGKDYHGGRYSICIDGCTLVDEAWPYDYFPIASVLPKPQQVGWRSVGVPQRLAGYQLELFRLASRIGTILRLHANPRVYVWSQAGVNQRQLETNELGTIIRGNKPAGQAIQQLDSPRLPPELVSREQDLIKAAYQQERISDATATASMPAAESGVARQMRLDDQAEQQVLATRSWERFHVRVAELVLDALRALSDAGVSAKVLYEDDAELQELDWDEVDVRGQKTRIKTQPTALLAGTPSAQLDKGIMLMDKGLLNPEALTDMLEFPDVKRALRKTTSAQRAAETIVQRWTDGDMIQAIPTAHLDLVVLQSVAVQVYQDMIAERADEKTLDPIRRGIEFVQKMLEKKDAPEGGAPEGGAPPGPPGAPPPPNMLPAAPPLPPELPGGGAPQ